MVADAMHKLSDYITPLYAQVAPQSFANMTGEYDFINISF